MRFLLFLIVTLTTSLHAAAQAAERVQLLTVVTGTERPLQVILYSKQDAIKSGAFGGVIGGLIGEGIKQRESAKFAEILNRTVPQFDRKPAVQNAIKDFFDKKYPAFEIVIAESGKYFTGKDVNSNQLKADGYRFMLVVDDLYTGLRAPNGYFSSDDLVYPAVGLEYRLYDADSKKFLVKNSREGRGLETKPMQQALEDRAFFESKYASILDVAVRDVVGHLNKTDQLHVMASSVGLGDKVPAIGKLLAQYEQQFTYSLAQPKGWKPEKATTKYAAVTGPTGKDRPKFGMSYNVDLLLPELGQAVSNLDDYTALFFGRLQEMGYRMDTLKEFADLRTERAYKTFVIDRPDGVGKELLLFRIVDPTFVEIFGVVFIDNYDKYLAQYKSDILSVVDKTTLKISNMNQK
jgi:hypothetical protein